MEFRLARKRCGDRVKEPAGIRRTQAPGGSGRVQRRAFLQLGPAAAAQTALAAQSPDVVVVGAGSFGGWTALQLLEREAGVALVDAYGPGNARSASGGLSRLVRARYTDEIYVRLMSRAFELWRRWEENWDERFLIPTGYLSLVDPGPLPASITDARKLLTKYRIASEILGVEEIRRRYPQLRLDDVGAGYWEPGACTARPADSCRRVARATAEAGARVLHARAELGDRSGRRLESVRLSTGETLRAGAFAFACGPWLAKTLPKAMAGRLRTPRREVFFWGTPPGDPAFTHPRFPAWSDRTLKGRDNSYYGFPDFDGLGLRVIPTNDANPLDPDSDERVVSPFQLKRAHDYVRYRFPRLEGQPVIGGRVCQTEYTPDSHFIIDRHPDFDNVWIVGGGSGHGFKHGPAVGEFAANRILGREVDSGFRRMFAFRQSSFPQEQGS